MTELADHKDTELAPWLASLVLLTQIRCRMNVCSNVTSKGLEERIGGQNRTVFNIYQSLTVCFGKYR